MMTVAIFLLIILCWVVGIGAVAGSLIGQLQKDWQKSQCPVIHHSWPLMISGSIAGVAGCFIGFEKGYQRGLELQTSCLSGIACGLAATFDGIISSILGTMVGALLGAIVLAMTLWFISWVTQRDSTQ